MRRSTFVVAVLTVAFIAVAAVRASPANTYPKCQCTWYVAERRPDLTDFKGHAKDWDTLARDHGFPVVSTPHVGDAVVFEPGVQGADSTYGHVAYVEQVNIGGDPNKFQVSEYNFGKCYDTCTKCFRVASTGSGVSFIRPKEVDNALSLVSKSREYTASPAQETRFEIALQNTGTTVWDPTKGYALRESLTYQGRTTSKTLSLAYAVNPGDAYSWFFAKVTGQLGDFLYTYQMINGRGQPFGDQVSVTIKASPVGSPYRVRPWCGEVTVAPGRPIVLTFGVAGDTPEYVNQEVEVHAQLEVRVNGQPVSNPKQYFGPISEQTDADGDGDIDYIRRFSYQVGVLAPGTMFTIATNYFTDHSFSDGMDWNSDGRPDEPVPPGPISNPAMGLFPPFRCLVKAA